MHIKSLKENFSDHLELASAIRFLSAEAVHRAASGHQGMPIGMADVATVLFQNHLKFDASCPDWPDRDRFILSAGHGSMLLYALLYLTGYEDMTIDQIKNFRQWGAITAGHPEFGHAKGIETTTGPLGQGLANAVGFAIAEEAMRARFSRKLVDHDTYVFAGDGCLMEGVSHEAIGLAGKQRLSKLIVFWDDNNISIDGRIDLSDETNQILRFEAAGWSVFECDGHNPKQIDKAIRTAKRSERPSLIACRTKIALGVEGVEDTASGHGYAIKGDQLKAMREAYDWTAPAFEIPEDILARWRKIGLHGAEARQAWDARLADTPEKKRIEFERRISATPKNKLSGAIRRLKKATLEERPKVATRKASQNVLEVINPILPELIGGSADLTGSNNTLTPVLGRFDPENRIGRHIYYGIREHAMAAVMNGMSLHGGIRPYGGTFMAFTDYARPAMRLAALMQQPVTFVMTHDSIGLGEDGPTHQPVEHLAISRATPNTVVIRPADQIETAEAWEIAASATTSPTVLSLTRQSLPMVRKRHTSKNLVEQGGYILEDAACGPRKVILIASGSEVKIALEARELLEKSGIGTRVVSMPSFELFDMQDEAYRKRVLPAGAVRIGIEAASQFGWDKYLTGERGHSKKAAFIGMKSFGASAPSERLYEEFGITPEAIISTAKALLGGN